ncbi:Ankyrin repeat-containing protein [Paenibacillus sp. OV219]|nr:Ankyrin repeat-containing protein [Paenibacillus sp. OV219]
MSVAPRLRGGTTYIPLRFMSDATGGQLILYGKDGGNVAWFLSANQQMLERALYRVDLVTTEKWLKLGADPSVELDPGILHSAISNNRINMVKYLLDNGADPTLDSFIGSPLEIAKRDASYEIIQLVESYLNKDGINDETVHESATAE